MVVKTLNVSDNISAKGLFRVEGIDIPYEVFINKRLKNIRISIDADEIKVCIPFDIEICEIERLLFKKRGWILKHYSKVKAVQAERHARKWENGEKVLFKGCYKNIGIRSSEGVGVRVVFDGKEFIVYTGDKIDAEKKAVMIGEAFRKLYIRMAGDEINNRLEYYKHIIGVSYNNVRIKEQKTRWGSCSRKGNLNFNWKIVMAPPKVMDYVIIHELCHIKHMDHSKQFWGLVQQYMPEYKEARSWLRENGINLTLI